VRPLPLACPAAAARLPCRSNAPLFPASAAPSSLLAARRHHSPALLGPLDCAAAGLPLPLSLDCASVAPLSPLAATARLRRQPQLPGQPAL